MQFLESPRYTREAEAELARLAAGGDSQAREALIHSQIPWVLRLATRVAQRSPHEREELIGRGLALLCEKIDRFDPARGRLTTFVGTFVYRDLLRAAPRRPRAVSLQEAHEARIVRERPEPPENEAVERLQRGVDQLPPRLRAVVRGRLAGEKFQTIAERLGVSKARVGQLEKKAHAQLRAWLRDKDHP
jgi:RNA polymerase sigma factor (sigma-70 family)